MEQVLIRLEAHQKSALQARATERRSSLAAEVREAVDQYLEGPADRDELAAKLQLLDRLSRQAEEDLNAMSDRMDRTLEILQRGWAEIEAIRAGRGKESKP